MANTSISSFSQRRATLVQYANLLLMLAVFVFVILRLVTLGFDRPPIPAGLVFVLTVCNFLYVHFRGSRTIASWLLLVVMALGLVSSGINTGGFEGPTILMAPMLPVLALLLIGTRAGLIACAVVILILSGLFVAEVNGLISPNPQSAEAQLVTRFIALLATVLVCSLVAWEFARMNHAMLGVMSGQALTDHLTGLKNRRALEESMAKELRRARRSKGWVSLIICDVDHFKHYNDFHGHSAGDTCLIAVANVLKAAARRPHDLVCRYGGEEFVALLPDTRPNGAYRVAEAMRAGLESQKIPYRDQDSDCVTLTLGVVSVAGADIDDMESLLDTADQALYAGKEEGRNRVIAVNLSEGAVVADVNA